MRRARASLAVVLAAVAPAGAGTLRGTVDRPSLPAQKVAQRYADGTPGEPREMGSIPAVVFVKGPVAGHPAVWPAKPLVINQRELRFQPPLAVVPVGGSVSFPNDDDEYHNVFSYSKAKRFDLGRYPKGESKTVTFDRPGVVKVYCEIHPWMRAAVVVVENPYYAEVGEDGSFVIEGVPNGRHTLVVWDIDGGSEDRQVEVSDDGAARIQLELDGARRAAALDERELVVRSVAVPGGDAGCCGPAGGVEE